MPDPLTAESIKAETTQGTGKPVISQPAAAGETIQLVEKKTEAKLLVGSSKEEVKCFNDDEWVKIRGKFNVASDFLGQFSFGQLAEGGGKGGSLMGKTPDNNFLVKEMNDTDHTSLLRLTKSLVEIMVRGETLVVPIYAHFERKGVMYVVMSNCLPSGIKWECVFDLKGCRDDRAIVLGYEEIKAVHKRCFSCLQCWYCCDIQCCPCYPEARGVYYNGKKHSFSCDLVFSNKQAESIRNLIQADSCAFKEIETMDYSLLMAYVSEDEKMVQAGEASESFKRALNKSKYVCTHNGKVYAYFLGIIDYLQEWNLKKDIARCIKACAPKPLSTVPPNLYADQFCANLSKRIKGKAKAFVANGEPRDRKVTDETDALEVQVEIKDEETPMVKATNEGGQPVEVNEEKKMDNINLEEEKASGGEGDATRRAT